LADPSVKVEVEKQQVIRAYVLPPERRSPKRSTGLNLNRTPPRLWAEAINGGPTPARQFEPKKLSSDSLSEIADKISIERETKLRRGISSLEAIARCKQRGNLIWECKLCHGGPPAKGVS